MYSKTCVIDRSYSRADISELKRIGKEIKESKKSVGYRHAIDDFIKATT